MIRIEGSKALVAGEWMLLSDHRFKAEYFRQRDAGELTNAPVRKPAESPVYQKAAPEMPKTTIDSFLFGSAVTRRKDDSLNSFLYGTPRSKAEPDQAGTAINPMPQGRSPAQERAWEALQAAIASHEGIGPAAVAFAQAMAQ